MLHRESYPKYTDTFIKERENIRYKYLDSHQYTTQNEMGRRIVGKIAGSTSKRQFMRPVIQIEPQPSLQVSKRQFKRPGSQTVQQVHVLLPAQPAPEPQTIMHEPFPAPQWHFMPL